MLADDDLVVVERRKLGALEQHDRHDDDREREVHHRSHHQAPGIAATSSWKELVGRAGAGVFRGFACHLDVAAERNRADAIFGVAAPEREKLRAEPQREREDTHADAPRHDEMPELVNENQDAEDK